MNELSLFTGAGGGIYASKLLNWKTIGYVEINEYCQQVIAARTKDGTFDRAPIFTDVREFVESGAARQYRGFVDVVSAGFPCQPFSFSGKQKGDADERNMWPATIASICEVRPQYAFLENVPGLLAHEYMGKILEDLAEVFSDIRGLCVGNSDIGGGVCNSSRLWIVASASNRPVLEGVDFSEFVITDTEESCRRQHSRAIGAMLSQDDYTELKRDSDAVANGQHRLKAIGNGQIPGLAATAWEVLS